jgi:hypothetical protein
MTTIVTRSGKGSPLTHTEVDTNFTNLNTAKLETAAIPLGTLQAPSVSFLNDSDTGIFCPQGGNSLAIATGGQYAITCSSTQAVGIKTANPQGALQVAGSTRIGANDATDAFLEIGEGATGNRNSYIDIVGDTTYTDYGLRVIRNNTGANATSELKHRGTGALNFTTEEAAPIVFYTTNSPALTITSGGLVGIGSSNPQALLHISSATTATERISGTAGNSDNTECANIDFQNNTSGSVVGRIRSLTGVGGIQSGKGQLAFFAHNGTSLLERVRINEDGLVGIGTTTVSSNLHIKPTTGDDSVFTNGLRVERNDTSGQYGLFNYAGGAASITAVETTASNPVVRFLRSTNGSTTTETARFDASGRLLVGTDTQVGVGGVNAQHAFVGTTSGQWAVGIQHTDSSIPYGLAIKYTAATPNDTSKEFFYCEDSSTLRLAIRSNGGVSNYSANNSNLSDRNVKKDIALAAGTWDCIKEWEIVNYRYKDQPDDADLNLGVIAQQVAESCPEVITIFQEAKDATEDKPAQEERLGVKEQQMYWMAIKALQEAMGRIEALETEVSLLKAA